MVAAFLDGWVVGRATAVSRSAAQAKIDARLINEVPDVLSVIGSFTSICRILSTTEG